MCALSHSDSVCICVRTTPCRHFGNVRLFPIQPKESDVGLIKCSFPCFMSRTNERTIEWHTLNIRMNHIYISVDSFVFGIKHYIEFVFALKNAQHNKLMLILISNMNCKNEPKFNRQQYLKIGWNFLLNPLLTVRTTSLTTYRVNHIRYAFGANVCIFVTLKKKVKRQSVFDWQVKQLSKITQWNYCFKLLNILIFTVSFITIDVNNSQLNLC